jgi:hypothetical protein
MCGTSSASTVSANVRFGSTATREVEARRSHVRFASKADIKHSGSHVRLVPQHESGPTIGSGYDAPKGSPTIWVRSYNEVRGADTVKSIAVGIEVIAAVDVSKGPLRSTSCELHCMLLAECSSG